MELLQRRISFVSFTLLVCCQVAGPAWSVPPAQVAPAAPGAEAALPPPVEPLKLPKEPVQALRGFVSEVEDLLLQSARGKAKAKNAARARLRELAIVPTYFDGEMDAFLTAVGEVGRAKTVRLTSVEVNATLWYGILPVRDVKLVFWTSGEGLRLLRMASFDLPMEPFKRKTPNAWAGPVPTSFGVLAEEVLREATDGECARLPFVSREDYAAVLPRDKGRAEQTLAYLEKFRFKIATTCHGLQGSPWHSLTWALGELGGVVTTRDGKRLTFKMDLVQGPRREVRLYRLRRPTPPRKTTDVNTK